MTKKKQKEQCKSILYKYNLGEKLSREDALFVIKIFKNHPNWKEKYIQPIIAIEVDRDQFNSRCFYLVYKDKTKNSISYTTSIKGTDLTHKQKVIKACRNSIYPIIKRFKSSVNFGIDVCPFSNEILYYQNTHIDHYDLTFNQMFNLWISKKNINEIKIKKTKQVYYFENKTLEKEFVDFHNNNCKLRAILDKINLTL